MPEDLLSPPHRGHSRSCNRVGRRGLGLI
jgi:hypothetical protein